MRILHVTPYYRDAWAYGGIPRIAAALAEAQAAHGHTVTVWTTDAGIRDRLGPGRLRTNGRPGTDVVHGVTVHTFPNVSNRLAYGAQAFVPLGWRSHAARSACSFDVAHLHACRNLPGAWSAAALRRAGVPYVLAPNGTAPVIERFHVAKRTFDWLLGRRVLDGAARLIAVSDAERRHLLELGAAVDRIRVIGNPIVTAEFASMPERGRFRAAHGIGSRPLVVFLGKLTPRKRVDVVLEAFAMLEPMDARLVVAGNDMGTGPAAHERARRPDLHGRVHFTGLIHGTERLAALADADVVVYPGQHENLRPRAARGPALWHAGDRGGRFRLR